MEMFEALEQIVEIIDKVYADKSVSQYEKKTQLVELRNEIWCHLGVAIESLG